MQSDPDLSPNGQRKRVLLIAYKIEAGRGSEDESGYQFARHLAEHVELTLISRANNCEKLSIDPAFAGVNFVPIDVPRWASFYKRGGRGIIPYYYTWQLEVGRRVRGLLRGTQFDVIHQFNFHADWAPHFLPPGSPIVWGPIAHHQVPPLEANAARTTRPYLGEMGRWAVKRAFWHFDPFLRAAIRRSQAIVYANPDVAPAFRGRSTDLYFRPYAGSNGAFQPDRHDSAGFRALFVGRLVPLKGPLLAVEAWAKFLRRVPDAVATFHVVGAGPLEQAVRRRISELGVSDSVQVLPWLSRSELARQYVEAALLLYPSVEAQGLVVSEAMASGVPVLGIAGTGPAYLAGDAGVMAARGPVRTLTDRLALELADLYQEFTTEPESYRTRFLRARSTYDDRLDWSCLLSDFLEIYDRVAPQTH